MPKVRACSVMPKPDLNEGDRETKATHKERHGRSPAAIAVHAIRLLEHAREEWSGARRTMASEIVGSTRHLKGKRKVSSAVVVGCWIACLLRER